MNTTKRTISFALAAAGTYLVLWIAEQYFEGKLIEEVEALRKEYQS